MKKIPTLFERDFSKMGRFTLTDKVKEGMEWVLAGDGVATIKMDGSCCAIINGLFYKRFDARPGKKIPVGAIPCCDPDPVTGHHPHWVKVDPYKPEDKWFWAALQGWFETHTDAPEDGTYEAIGKHFQGNPYGLEYDTLYKHGSVIVSVDRSFDGIRDYLQKNYIEGLVFWKDGEPQCKIKRTDYGLEWNGKTTKR